VGDFEVAIRATKWSKGNDCMAFISGTIWITGLSASGKTTLGNGLLCAMQEEGIKNIKLLDGEELRKNFDRKYGHSLSERYAVLSKIVQIARDFNRKGFISIVCTISHKSDMRQLARKQISDFMEVYLKCPPEVCAQRDYKGNYERVKNTKSECFPGVSEPYEETDNVELILDSACKSVEQCVNELLISVLNFLRKDLG